MITKAEWYEWKTNKITQQLVELVTVGKMTALQSLIGMRGEIGDFPRGSHDAYEEVLELISTGDGFYSKED